MFSKSEISLLFKIISNNSNVMTNKKKKDIRSLLTLLYRPIFICKPEEIHKL